MPVNSTNAEYNSAQDRWRTTRDAAEGQEAVKKGTTRYLPDFIPSDEARYKQYLNLAYYVNVTGRTRNGLVGATFRRDGEVSLPDSVAYLEGNADGGGQSLTQLSKALVSDLLVTGRYGLLADYPNVDGVLSQEEVQRRGLQASIKSYKPESIINWKTTTVDGVKLLSMVVLKEAAEVMVDDFSSKSVDQYRVLQLVEGVYWQALYDEELKPVSAFQPRQFKGEPWTVIPFTFSGAEDNTPSVDLSPLFDLANINLAHYRNIADHESSLRVFSQVMLHVDIGEMSTEQWTELNPNGVTFGSGFGLQTVKGNANIIQAEPHSKCSQAILDKEQQMVSVGARLISTEGINQTAEEARINASSENSVLDTVVGNASEAMEAAIEFCVMFMGGNPEEVVYSLNREFFDSKISAQEQMTLIQFADRGDISQADLREKLRKSGVIDQGRTDEEIDEDRQSEAPI